LIIIIYNLAAAATSIQTSEDQDNTQDISITYMAKRACMYALRDRSKCIARVLLRKTIIGRLQKR